MNPESLVHEEEDRFVNASAADAIDLARKPAGKTLSAGIQPKRWPLKGCKFVWLLTPPWDDVWTRQNHFTIRLARLGAEVLYVENPSSWSARLRNGNWRNSPPGSRVVREIRPGLHVMRPAIHLPGTRHSDLIGKINGYLVARQIKNWIQWRTKAGQGSWADYTCWCRAPHSLFALDQLDPSVTIYDITDDYELYEDNLNARKRTKIRESKLIARANTVFITSNELRQKGAIREARAHLAPNGVEVDLFAQASAPGELHPSVDIGKPVIGYIGLTSHWMDFALLERLGRRWPGQVIMIGPISPQVEARARAIPGIVWLGFVPQHKLPPYIRGFDVCIMPHVVNELRRRSNPLKIWEYLAMGKPFVSVDLPALQPVADLVDTARNADEFLNLVEKNLAQPPNPGMIVRRQTAARAFSWDAIFSEVLARLLSRLESEK